MLQTGCWDPFKRLWLITVTHALSNAGYQAIRLRCNACCPGFQPSHQSTHLTFQSTCRHGSSNVKLRKGAVPAGSSRRVCSCSSENLVSRSKGPAAVDVREVDCLQSRRRLPDCLVLGAVVPWLPLVVHASCVQLAPLPRPLVHRLGKESMHVIWKVDYRLIQTLCSTPEESDFHTGDDAVSRQRNLRFASRQRDLNSSLCSENAT